MSLRDFFKKKELTPGQAKVYHAARAAEMGRIQVTKEKAELGRINAKAVRDAQIASAGRGSRVAGALVTAGRSVAAKIEKMDTDKFEAYVTGVSLSKPKKKE